MSHWAGYSLKETVMKTITSLFTALVIAIAATATASEAHDTFTYQGQLTQLGEPLAGAVDLKFRLYDAAMNGEQVGDELAADRFAAFDADGRFTIDLAFGKGVFDGTPLWLEIEVNGIILSPRQPIRPSPYAIRALTESWQPDGPHVHYPVGNVGIGASAPNRPLTVQGTGGVSELLQFRSVDGTNRWHLNLSGGGVNLAETGVADFRLHVASGGNVGIGTGSPSSRLSVNGSAHFLGNVGVRTSNPAAALQVVGSQVFGAANNTAHSANSFVSGGGASMPNSAGGAFSFAGGGQGNAAIANFSFVGGGAENSATGGNAFVAGGFRNHAGGSNSFAAGRGANALHSGTFVWGDSQAADFNSTGNNQFLIRALGGVGIGTNNPANALSVNGGADFSGNVGIGLSNPNARLHIRHFENPAIWGIRIQNADQDAFQAGLRMTSTGFLEATNNAQALTPNVARLNSTGNWTAVSDGRIKRDVHDCDGLLDAALALRPVSFRYTNTADDSTDREHIGFIAQEVEDVLPAFVTGSGQDLRTLNYAGLSAVAIGAIQELKREKDAEIQSLRDEVAQLRALVERRMKRSRHQGIEGDSALIP